MELFQVRQAMECEPVTFASSTYYQEFLTASRISAFAVERTSLPRALASASDPKGTFDVGGKQLPAGWVMLVC